MRQSVFCGLLSTGLSPDFIFAEFQNMRAEGVLANLPWLRFTGTLGAAVCCKMLCYVAT